MAAIKRDYSNNTDLERIKKNVSSSYSYYKDNYIRFRDYRTYVFKESVNTQQKAMLQQLQRPVVEFNFLESDVDRLVGEFFMHEPSIKTSPTFGKEIDQNLLDLVEGNIRHTVYEADKDQFSSDIYTDQVSGGFSVAKVYPEFESPMSFKYKLCWEKCFDATLCGADPMARTKHKGDGKFTYEIIPFLEEDFKEQFPEVNVNVSYVRDMQDFHWSYKDDSNKKIILVADYYEKKKVKRKIVELADGRTLTVEQYKKMKNYWEENNFIEQFPIIVNKRTTEIVIICNYKLIETQILEYHETDYTFLPHVWFMGNSRHLTQGTDNTSYEMTKPYAYHARGIQDMVNFAGQTLCNSMENLIQHKFIVKKEAIPQERDYIEALNNVQNANTIVVNAYSENNPDKPIPEPIREVTNVPLPPEVTQSFEFAAQMKQTILGGFASNLQKNDNDLSGKAVVEIQTVGNASAMPAIQGYLAGLTQMARIHIDLMPKYLFSSKILPVMNKRGDRYHENIGPNSNLSLNYESGSINVEITAGVNFQVQKNQAVAQITALMNANEEWGQFFNSPRGMKMLAKNLTIYGADDLPDAIDEFHQQKQQQQQQAMQMQQQAMMQNPQMIRAQAEAQKVQSDIQSKQIETQLDIAKLAIDKELADAKILEAESKITQSQIDSAVRLEEAQTSREIHALDSAAKIAEVHAKEHKMHVDTHKASIDERKLQHDLKKNSEEHADF